MGAYGSGDPLDLLGGINWRKVLLPLKQRVRDDLLLRGKSKSRQLALAAGSRALIAGRCLTNSRTAARPRSLSVSYTHLTLPTICSV